MAFCHALNLADYIQDILKRKAQVGKSSVYQSIYNLKDASNITNYLKGVMNGHATLPVNAWKAEYAKLTTEQKTLNQQYLSLKDNVKEAEQIRKSVYSILRQEQRGQQPRKTQDMDR